MKNYEVTGYLVVVLRTVEFCDLETLTKIPNSILADEYSFYSGNIKLLSKNDTKKTIRAKELQNSIPKSWTSRFNRLQKIHSRYYKYELHYTNDSISSIVSSVKSENVNRLLVMQSKDMIGDFSELVKIFRLNSFLYQRLTKARLADQLYFRAGFISEKKLDRMLTGKGRSIYAETFQIMDIILDKDFTKNVDNLRPKIRNPLHESEKTFLLEN